MKTVSPAWNKALASGMASDGGIKEPRQVTGMTLAAVRAARSMTAASLARQLSIPLEELLAVESGGKTPRLCEAQKWANVLGLTFEEFGRHFYELADAAASECDHIEGR